MGAFSFVSFVIILSIILTNEFGGIDAHGKKYRPPTVDWQTYGAVTPAKSQGPCDSSYAFAPVAVFETLHFIKTRNLISLSEQQIIDCTSTGKSKFRNYGCDGGYVENVLNYMVKEPKHGSETDYDYPNNPGACRYDPKDVVLNISRWNYVSCDGFPGCTRPNMDEEAMARAVFKAPIIAHIYASCLGFESYGSGVFSDECCSNKTSYDVNHVVAIIGYGKHKKRGPYWIIKNNWGSEWGYKGFLRIKRGNNQCGIATKAIAVHL